MSKLPFKVNTLLLSSVSIFISCGCQKRNSHSGTDNGSQSDRDPRFRIDPKPNDSPQSAKYQYTLGDKVVLSQDELIAHEYFRLMYEHLERDPSLYAKYKREFIAALRESADTELSKDNAQDWDTTQPQTVGNAILIDLNQLLFEQSSPDPTKAQAPEGALAQTIKYPVVQMPVSYYARLARTSLSRVSPNQEQSIIAALGGSFGGLGNEANVLSALNNSFSGPSTDHLQYVFDFMGNNFQTLNYLHQLDLQRQYYNTHPGTYSDITLRPGRVYGPTGMPSSPSSGSSPTVVAGANSPNPNFGAGAVDGLAPPNISGVVARGNLVTATCDGLMDYVRSRGVYSPDENSSISRYHPTFAGLTPGHVEFDPTYKDGHSYQRGGRFCYGETIVISKFRIDSSIYQITWISEDDSCATEVARWNEGVRSHELRHQQDFRNIQRDIRSGYPSLKLDVCGNSNAEVYNLINPQRTKMVIDFRLFVNKAMRRAVDDVHKEIGHSASCNRCEQSKPPNLPQEGAHGFYAAPNTSEFTREGAQTMHAAPVSAKQRKIIMLK